MDSINQTGSSDMNFFFEVTYFKRTFKGQTSGPRIHTEKICANTKQDVLNKIFDFSKNHILREIIFSEIEGKRVPEWSPSSSKPIIADANKYLIFQDKLKNKKAYKWDEITENLLKSWRFKEIGVLIHVYSLSLECSSDYEIAKTKLLMPAERDRSGAQTTETIIELSQRLQVLHPYLEADPISWKIWANSILATNPADQESLVTQLPSSHIGQNFRFKSAESVQLNAARSQISAARNLNIGYSDDIRQLRHSLNAVIDAVKVLTMHVEVLERRRTMEDSLISSVEQAMQPQESQHSAQIRSLVTDQIDVDHL